MTMGHIGFILNYYDDTSIKSDDVAIKRRNKFSPNKT
jgi:hypothetical protein